MSEVPAVPSLEGVADVSLDSPADDVVTSEHTLAGSASPTDAASSLRAAALLTLKSKRRKPMTDGSAANLSQRPVPSTLVLNYGEEDSTPSTPAPASDVKKVNPSPGKGKAKASDIEDNREEGEISDTESNAPSKAPTTKTSVADNNAIQATSKASPSSAKHPATIKQEPITPIAGPSIVAELPARSHLVDENHVRPGLASSYQLPHPEHRLTL